MMYPGHHYTQAEMFLTRAESTGDSAMSGEFRELAIGHALLAISQTLVILVESSRDESESS